MENSQFFQDFQNLIFQIEYNSNLMQIHKT